MGTTHKNFSKLTAGVSTRADLMSYFNANMDAIDALLAGIYAGPSVYAESSESIGFCLEATRQIGISSFGHELWLRSLTTDGAIACVFKPTGNFRLWTTEDASTYTKVFEVDGAGALWVVGGCSALSFTDRTPHFGGDALDAIRKIKATEKGEIDHASLPDFVVSPYQDEKGEWWPGRSLGDMVSVLTVAIQQLAASYDAAIADRDAKIAELSAKIDALAAKIPA